MHDQQRNVALLDKALEKHPEAVSELTAMFKGDVTAIEAGPEAAHITFQTLPAEVRNVIYEFALSSPSVVEISLRNGTTKKRQQEGTARDGYVVCASVSTSRNSKARFGGRLGGALLGTSRTVGSEALPVLLSCNKFVFTNPPAFREFASCIGEGTRFLRHINIGEFWAQRHVDALSSLKRNRDLRRLGVHRNRITGPIYGNVFMDEAAWHIWAASGKHILLKKCAWATVDTCRCNISIPFASLFAQNSSISESESDSLDP